MVWSPGGKLVAASVDGGPGERGPAERATVQVWQATTGDAVAAFPSRGAVTSLACAPDETRVAVAYDDATISVWDLATGQEAARLFGPASFRSLTWEPGARPGRLAAVQTRRVHVFDVQRSELRDILFEHERWAQGALWLPSGAIASVGREGSVRLWNVTTGRPFGVHPAHPGPVAAMAWAHGGRRLFTAAADGRVSAWRVEPWAEVHRFEAGARPVGLSCDAGGEHALVLLDPQTAVLHRTDTGARVGEHRGDDPASWAFHPLRARLLVTSGSTITVADFVPPAAAAPRPGPPPAQVFVSYNTADRDAVAAFLARVGEAGHTLWFDRDRLEPGLLLPQFDQALAQARHALVFVGPAGLGRFQQREVGALVAAEVTGSLRPVIVRLPGVTLDQVPPTLRAYQATTSDEEGLAFVLDALGPPPAGGRAEP